jgi:hypothetical protein
MLGTGLSIATPIPALVDNADIYSLDFNGSSHFLNLANVVSDIDTDKGSVTLWFKADADTTSQIWKCNQSTSAANNQLQIYYNASNNKIVFQQKYAGTSAAFTSAEITVGDDSWNFVAMSWTTDAMVSNLNGTTHASQAQEGDPFNPGKCTAAKNAAADNLYFDGHINEIAMFDVALTGAQMIAIYNSGLPFDLTVNNGDYTQSRDLIGYWRFEAGTGTTVADRSNNGNTATISHSGLYTTDTP